GNIPHNSEEKIDCTGLFAMPGLIDPHVHLREPGQEYKENFLTGSKAAIAGGFTSIIDMPNNKDPTTTLQRLRKKVELSKKAICTVYFHFGASNDNFLEVKKAEGFVKGLKFYLDKTTGNLIINERNIIERHFLNFDRNKPAIIHAEGKNIELALELAKKANRKLHLAHCTTKEEVELIKAWKKGTVEVTPHHLLLSKKDQENVGLVKPPLRPDMDRKGLWTVLDRIDCIATDHAPHTAEEKEDGAFGYAGLETSLALMIDQYNKNNLTLEWITKRMSYNPAKIFGLKGEGELKVGANANITLVDLRQEWTVKQEELETKCKLSPYDGWKLKGKVKKVIFDGKLRYDDGEIQ
ncbi:MAG: dihydroorotase family protein, partial [Candidatus Micrarchaeota archaeon]|nr:dihydroorotase family protein [Candidatus Micrarchaeota archaeon]